MRSGAERAADEGRDTGWVDARVGRDARARARRGERRRGGLAFNYLGFPREEAIHLRVYAIFGGEIAPGARECRRAFFEILRQYIPAYSFRASGRPAATGGGGEERGAAGLFISAGAMNPALSLVVSRDFPRWFPPRRFPRSGG